MSLNKEFVITPKVRNSNLELYRIIVMLLIVMHHYVVNSGLMALMEEDPLNPKSIFLYIVGMWGKTGINCFVLITGYYMCKSEITLRKFLKLLLEIEFYNIAIYSVFLFAGYIDFSPYSFLLYILPLHDGAHQGFVTCFLLFYMLIPFLSVLVNHLDKRQHLTLLLSCLTIYTFIPLIPGFGVTMNYVSWFCVLFVLGSYLRLYPNKYDSNTRFWLISMLVSISIAILSVVVLLYLNSKGISIISIYPYRFVEDSNAPLAVIVSICAFMYFRNLKIKHNNFINIVGGCTFAVLLIHANSGTMRQWLWKHFCNNVGHYAYDSIYLHAILVPIAVFVICSIIEYFRMKVIERPLLDFTYNMVHKYFPNAK